MKDNEKQAIEEMASVLESAKIDAHATIGSMNNGFGMWYATAAYNAGYRKQSEPNSCGHENGGEWRWISDDCVMCNRCGKTFDSDDYADAWTFKFCPNCGAKMKGGDHHDKD